MRWLLNQFVKPSGRDARNEQKKLSAALINSVAITLTIAGLFGPYLNQSSLGNVTPEFRIAMLLGGLLSHLFATWTVRGIEDKLQ